MQRRLSRRGQNHDYGGGISHTSRLPPSIPSSISAPGDPPLHADLQVHHKIIPVFDKWLLHVLHVVVARYPLVPWKGRKSPNLSLFCFGLLLKLRATKHNFERKPWRISPARPKVGRCWKTTSHPPSTHPPTHTHDIPPFFPLSATSFPFRGRRSHDMT